MQEMWINFFLFFFFFVLPFKVRLREDSGCVRSGRERAHAHWRSIIIVFEIDTERSESYTHFIYIEEE